MALPTLKSMLTGMTLLLTKASAKLFQSNFMNAQEQPPNKPILSSFFKYVLESLVSIKKLVVDTQLFIENNLTYILFVLSFVLVFSIPYILEVVPHCCEDIHYLYGKTLLERYESFEHRTISEGRWVFGFISQLLSGYFITYLSAFISILVTVVNAMFLTSLWGCKKKQWVLISLLLSFNPFLLSLYPFPLTFSVFNFGNLLVVLAFYFYCKESRLIWITPLAIFVSLGIYQVTLSFLLQVVFIHFIIRTFNSKISKANEELRFYGYYLLAVLIGYAFYFIIIIKIATTLIVHGEILRAGHGEILRAENWGHKELNTLVDYLGHGFDSFIWFINNGISSGLDSGKSVLVGYISLRDKLIIFYQIALLLVNFILILQSIYQKSKLKTIVSIGALPITIIVTILPLVVSGSPMINRTFYPFGLLLPALLLILTSEKQSFKISFPLWIIALFMILLMASFQAQVFNGMTIQSKFAKTEHREILNRLFMMPNYDIKDSVLIYPYVPEDSEKPRINATFWPLLSGGSNIGKFIKYYQSYEINIIGIKELNQEEILQIDDFLKKEEIPPWPHPSSVSYFSGIREGVFVIYYPYTQVKRYLLNTKSKWW